LDLTTRELYTEDGGRGKDCRRFLDRCGWWDVKGEG
jgi:hypothetical protein